MEYSDFVFVFVFLFLFLFCFCFFLFSSKSLQFWYHKNCHIFLIIILKFYALILLRLEEKENTSSPRYWYVPVLVNAGTFLVYQHCLNMWYLHFLERAGVIQKLAILERKNGLVLSNTCVPVSGTWSILFPKKTLKTHQFYRVSGYHLLSSPSPSFPYTNLLHHYSPMNRIYSFSQQKLRVAKVQWPHPYFRVRKQFFSVWWFSIFNVNLLNKWLKK